MAHLGEEASGFQGDGFIAYGQSSNAETNSDSYSNPSLRRASVLQGGYDGNPEILDDMEAELDNLQGPVEEARVEYDRCGYDES